MIAQQITSHIFNWANDIAQNLHKQFEIYLFNKIQNRENLEKPARFLKFVNLLNNNATPIYFAITSIILISSLYTFYFVIPFVIGVVSVILTFPFSHFIVDIILTLSKWHFAIFEPTDEIQLYLVVLIYSILSFFILVPFYAFTFMTLIRAYMKVIITTE